MTMTECLCLFLPLLGGAAWAGLVIHRHLLAAAVERATVQTEARLVALGWTPPAPATPRGDALYERMARGLSQDPAARREAARQAPASGRRRAGAVVAGVWTELAPLPLDAPVLEQERAHPLTRALLRPTLPSEPQRDTVLDGTPLYMAPERETPTTPR